MFDLFAWENSFLRQRKLLQLPPPFDLYEIKKQMTMLKPTDLIPGKIYFISFSINTQLVGRFKELETCNIIFFDYLHYWNSYESFRSSPLDAWCVKSGIEELREATLVEKHALIKFELENNCI